MSLKILSLVLMALASGAVQAEVIEPFRPQDYYEFTGVVQPLGATQYEKVSVITEAGRKRVADLRAQGFRCSHVNDRVYRCWRAVELDETPKIVEDRIQSQNKDLTLKFGHAKEPNIITDGEVYKEWWTATTVEFAGVIYSGYKTRYVHDNFQITLGEAGVNAVMTFNIREGSLFRYHEMTLTDGDRWISFKAAAVFASR